MTRLYRSIAEWKRERPSPAGGALGFVPTMGALHEGHLSLVRRSVEENAHTLVSIFVNPTQFNDPDDLKNYPVDIESDLELLRGAGATHVLAPERFDELYRDGYRFRVTEGKLSRELCGRHRPGHFDGVLTVVMKLLNAAGARRAYFGEKDYQQYLLVKEMTEAFFMDTEIIGCPIVREEDGLAMSSRNLLLSPDERAMAPRFAAVLREAPSAEAAAGRLAAEGFRVDYVEDRFGRRFGAVHLGKVRLIDNVGI